MILKVPPPPASRRVAAAAAQKWTAIVVVSLMFLVVCYGQQQLVLSDENLQENSNNQVYSPIEYPTLNAYQDLIRRHHHLIERRQQPSESFERPDRALAGFESAQDDSSNCQDAGDDKCTERDCSNYKFIPALNRAICTRRNRASDSNRQASEEDEEQLRQTVTVLEQIQRLLCSDTDGRHRATQDCLNIAKDLQEIRQRQASEAINEIFTEEEPLRRELVTRSMRMTTEEAKRFVELPENNQLIFDSQQPQSAKKSSSIVDGQSQRHQQQLQTAKRPPIILVKLRADSATAAAASSSSLDQNGAIRSRKQRANHLIGLRSQTRRSEPSANSNGNGNQTSGSNGLSEEAAPDDLATTALECNMRHYTFRASRSDDAGNECVGQVTAKICYGGCDTGEIADWLFPHKKSIHKVCLHGARVRRRAILADCNSEFAAKALREYHFVDAASCVCKKCTPSDTTCLGSLTRPYLATAGGGPASSSSSSSQPTAASAATSISY